MKTFLSLILILFSINISAQSMLVSDTESTNQTVSDLVENWLYKENLVLSNIDYAGNNKSIGTFSNGYEATGLSSGMILTTGRARTEGTEIGADGLSQQLADLDFFWFHNPGDARDIPPTTDTARNAVVLTLSFSAFTDTVYLDYVFGSEDYQNYDCLTGDDYIGIIISGPGYDGDFNYNGELISLLPDGSPIRVSTIHPETENCPESNENLYHETPVNQQPVYHGLSSKFTVALPIDPASIYRLKFLVADGQNVANDAGLFFNLRSCSEPICYLDDLEPSTLLEGCSDTIVSFDFSNFPDALPLTYSLTGTATPGVDYPAQAVAGLVTLENPLLSIDLSVFDDGEIEFIEDIRLNFTDITGASKEYLWFVGDNSDEWFLSREEVCTDIGISDNRGRSVYVESNSDNAITETFDFDYVFNEEVMASSQRFDFEVSGLPFEYLSSPYQINSFCLNTTGDNETYDLTLITPNGQRIALTDNLSDDNLFNCCFSPKASLTTEWNFNIVPTSPAPYTGSWQPSGNWESLKYSPANGTWSLLIKSALPTVMPDVILEDISMSFRQSTIPYLPLLWSDGKTQTVRMVNRFDDDDGILSVNLSEGDCLWSDTLSYSNSMMSQSVLNITVCQDDTVWYEGIPFSVGLNNLSGPFLLEGANVDGCDSIVEVYVFPQNERIGYSYYETNLDVPLMLEDTIISDYGYHLVNLTTLAGCDSLHYLCVLPPSPAAPNANISDLTLSSTYVSCEDQTEVCIPTDIGGYLNTSTYYINGDSVSNNLSISRCAGDELTVSCFNFPNASSNAFYRMPTFQFVVENPPPFIYFHDAQSLVAGLNLLEYPDNFWFETDGGSKICSYYDVSKILDYDRVFLPHQVVWTAGGMFPVVTDVLSGVNLTFPIGENTLTIEKENFPNDTVFVNVEREYPSPQSESFSITIGQFQSFLYPLDQSELCADIISVELCNNPSPSDIVVNLNPESGDFSIYTLNLGPQEICIQYCDSLNICDELLLTVNVVDDSNTTDEIADLTELKIYPNPVSNKLQIELNPLFSLEEIEIYSTLGQKVNSFNLNASALNFSVLDYPTGLYFLKIKTSIGVTKKKIMIVRD